MARYTHVNHSYVSVQNVLKVMLSALTSSSMIKQHALCSLPPHKGHVVFSPHKLFSRNRSRSLCKLPKVNEERSVPYVFPSRTFT